jgi:hypothetical protein
MLDKKVFLERMQESQGFRRVERERDFLVSAAAAEWRKMMRETATP